MFHLFSISISIIYFLNLIKKNEYVYVLLIHLISFYTYSCLYRKLLFIYFFERVVNNVIL